MEEKYYPKLNWEDYGTLEQKVRAIYNLLNNVSFEMSAGKVPNNKEELQNNIEMTKQELTTPLSIAFVKLAENGEIDEVTASENVNMFLAWNDNDHYREDDLRSYEGKLYRCLQAHASQEGWTPDTATSLWKELGISEDGTPEWSQPISSVDAYMLGDVVMFMGKKYRSIVDNNVWQPGIYGWEEVI